MWSQLVSDNILNMLAKKRYNILNMTIFNIIDSTTTVLLELTPCTGLNKLILILIYIVYTHTLHKPSGTRRVKHVE